MLEYRTAKNFTEEQLSGLFLSVGWFSGKFPERLRSAMLGSTRVISAWDGQTLVGLIRGLDDGAWQATIDCLLVRPEYQGRGIASSLLNRLMTIYEGFLYVYVVPDEKQNVRFYEKHGFAVMDEGTPMRISRAGTYA